MGNFSDHHETEGLSHEMLIYNAVQSRRIFDF